MAAAGEGLGRNKKKREAKPKEWCVEKHHDNSRHRTGMRECPTSWLPRVGETLSSLCPSFICEMGIVLREERYYILQGLLYGLLLLLLPWTLLVICWPICGRYLCLGSSASRSRMQVIYLGGEGNTHREVGRKGSQLSGQLELSPTGSSGTRNARPLLSTFPPEGGGSWGNYTPAPRCSGLGTSSLPHMGTRQCFFA